MEEQMMTSTTSFPLPRSAPPAWPLRWKRSRELELPTQNNTHSAQKKERFYDEDFPLKKKMYQTSVAGCFLMIIYACMVQSEKGSDRQNKPFKAN